MRHLVFHVGKAQNSFLSTRLCVVIIRTFTSLALPLPWPTPSLPQVARRNRISSAIQKVLVSTGQQNGFKKAHKASKRFTKPHKFSFCSSHFLKKQNVHLAVFPFGMKGNPARVSPRHNSLSAHRWLRHRLCAAWRGARWRKSVGEMGIRPHLLRPPWFRTNFCCSVSSSFVCSSSSSVFV